MTRRALLAVLMCAACGPAPSEFPIGFYGAAAPGDARALAAEGFDAVQTNEMDAGKAAALAAAARGERQLLLIAPEGVESPSHAARLFPGTQTAFAAGAVGLRKDAAGAADVVMAAWYPVPHLPLESAGDHVRLTAEAAGGRKVWAVLQAFDWRDFPQHDPKRARVGRFPTRAEIRFMSYDAVLNGANGVWYYSYSTAPASNLSQTPELMQAVAGPARELRAMAPIFARGRPIRLPFPFDPAGIAARAWTYRGRDYVVLANRKGDVALKVPDEMLAPRWRPLFEVRRDPRELLFEYKGTYYLKSYQVLVLESRLRLTRLLGR